MPGETFAGNPTSLEESGVRKLQEEGMRYEEMVGGLFDASNTEGPPIPVMPSSGRLDVYDPERLRGNTAPAASGIMKKVRGQISIALLWAASLAGGMTPEAAQAKQEGKELNYVETKVDHIQINHFYDDHGKHVFDQAIYLDWSEKDGRHQVRAWRLLKQESQWPALNAQSGMYEAIWRDGANESVKGDRDVLRKVMADSISETWTQYDPELVERTYLPREQRLELGNYIRHEPMKNPPRWEYANAEKKETTKIEIPPGEGWKLAPMPHQEPAPMKP